MGGESYEDPREQAIEVVPGYLDMEDAVLAATVSVSWPDDEPAALPLAVTVMGFCPACGGESLFLGDGGYVTCGRVECPRPDAVSEILSEREIHHIVHLYEATFTVLHPLRERLDQALLTCDLHAILAGADGPPAAPGTYRVYSKNGLRMWDRLGDNQEGTNDV